MANGVLFAHVMEVREEIGLAVPSTSLGPVDAAVQLAVCSRELLQSLTAGIVQVSRMPARDVVATH